VEEPDRHNGEPQRGRTAERRTTEVAAFREKGDVCSSVLSVRSVVSPSLEGIAQERRAARTWHRRPHPWAATAETAVPRHPPVTHSPASLIGRFPQKMKLIATAVILPGRAGALIDIERRLARAGRVRDAGTERYAPFGRRLTESRAEEFVGPKGLGLGASAARRYARSRAGRPCHSPPGVTHFPTSVIGRFS
jgi:hypothetical protein